MLWNGTLGMCGKARNLLNIYYRKVKIHLLHDKQFPFIKIYKRNQHCKQGPFAIHYIK